MLKIRRYEARDILTITDLAIRYVPELPNYKGIHVDRDRIEFTLTQNVTNDGTIACFVLVDDHDKVVGGIMAYCVTLLFSWQKVANDIFLFIEPIWRTENHAKGLVETYIEWAKARKVAIIGASQTSGYRSEALERFIKSFGFVEVGKQFHLRRDI